MYTPYHLTTHQLKSHLHTIQKAISIIWLLPIALVIGLALIEDGQDFSYSQTRRPSRSLLPESRIYTPETIPILPLTLLNTPGAENKAWTSGRATYIAGLVMLMTRV